MFGWLQRLRDRDISTAGGAWAQLRPIVAGKGIVPLGPLPGVMNGHVLNRVIPLAQSCRLSGGLLTLLSLEVYDDGTILNYFVLADEPARFTDKGIDVWRFSSSQKAFRQAFQKATQEERDRYIRGITGLPGSHLSFEVVDEPGTAYGSMPRGSHGDEATVRGAVGITPSIPSGVSRLMIRVSERIWFVVDGELKSELQKPPANAFVVDL